MHLHFYIDWECDHAHMMTVCLNMKNGFDHYKYHQTHLRHIYKEFNIGVDSAVEGTYVYTIKTQEKITIITKFHSL